MLVLLIIFMVAAPMMQRGVEVNLPTARNVPKLAETRIYVTVPTTFTKDRKVYLDDEAISIEFLAERTKQAMLGKQEREVFLRSDGAVTMQQVMEVFSSLREGGIERVGIVAQQRNSQ
jgi:biopolymer transport protein ExbD